MGVIWFALLIPILAAIVLKLVFKKQVTFPEMTAILGIPAVIIGIMALIGSTVPKTQEYWGGTIMYAEYEEEWVEWVDETCTETYQCGTDSDGNPEYCTRTYDCSHYTDHPPMWTLYESNGETFSVDQGKFEYLAKKWKQRSFVDMHREDNYTVRSSWHTRCKDGDMYVTKWRGKWDDMEPAITEHKYENKVRYSSSTFNFSDITDSLTLKKMIQYPLITSYYDCRSILGYHAKGWERADQELTKWNAVKGKEKEVRMYILLFKNEPLDIAEYQERFWKGGNMNEFIVMIGLNDSLGINWCHVTSWTENQALKINVRNFISSMGTLDFYKIVPYIGSAVEQGFKRKDFAKDFDYLAIEPSNIEIIITYILTLLSTGVIGFWSVINAFTTEGTDPRYIQRPIWEERQRRRYGRFGRNY